MELEAIIAALVPAKQFATLWSRAPSYHVTQVFSTSETARNRRSIVLILQDPSTGSGVFAQQFEHRSKLTINLNSCLLFKVAASDLRESLWTWASHEGECKDFPERRYAIFHTPQGTIT